MADTIPKTTSSESLRMTTAVPEIRIEEIDSKPSSLDIPMHLTKLIKNKLKRKQKLSISLTSMNDTVNQEKRTKMENHHRECLQENEQNAANKVLSKPPLPPKTDKHHHHNCGATLQLQAAKVPPPRLKRKLEENNCTIQKLNAQSEHLRTEIAELKTALGSERSAVRTLRAQNESETRKLKTEVKKLQAILENTRKSALGQYAIPSIIRKWKDEACHGHSHSAKDSALVSYELNKLNQEICAMKDANKQLEERIQTSQSADRRKGADIREMKDSYEIRLTQLSKSAKMEISRLLEEIKTKERCIGQMKKELQQQLRNKNESKNAHRKKDGRSAQHSNEMKKLKDLERTNNNNSSSNTINNNNTTKKLKLQTTCGDKEFHSLPHEITERILEAHNDAHDFESKDNHNHSDSDSALSSAPPSISPQPPPNGLETADIWQTIKNYSKDIEKLQQDYEIIQKDNDSLENELSLAKKQIEELEKTVFEANKQTNKMQQYMDRIKYLEQKESSLEQETHELREQNELLEFRILELEESNDKWSIRSNPTSDGKDMWTEGDKDSDEALLYTDRSDSGITSPHSQHHIDDRINTISPSDLVLLDHISNEELKRRLTMLCKKSTTEDEERTCLQQVLTLIHNLEVLSHDTMSSSDEPMSLELLKSRTSELGSSPASIESPSSSSSPLSTLQKPKLSHGRIVATVLPYNSSISTTPNESPKRARCWNTSSLTESGVFEGDFNCQCTQTEPEDFESGDSPATKDLCAEIQKLNKFREQIEECVTKKVPVQVPVPILSPNLSDNKRLQYYKERVELLEKKVHIYESSGDIQAKRLADRLQREIQLERLVKDLEERVECLEIENSNLEEEKCECEEAENDTRLRLQRLEVDLEILSQRNIELEMSREAAQNKLKDAKHQNLRLQQNYQNCQEMVEELEEQGHNLKNRISLLKASVPAMLLFNSFMVNGSTKKQGSCGCGSVQSGVNCQTTETMSLVKSLENELHVLRDREHTLHKEIENMNLMHREIMENADLFWKHMESDLKGKLEDAAFIEDSLKTKICQLEERLGSDSHAAQEKLAQLEEVEAELKCCMTKLSKDNRQLLEDNRLLCEEIHKIKEENSDLRRYIEGPAKEALEVEKKKTKGMVEEISYLKKIMCEGETRSQEETVNLRKEVHSLNRDLMQIEVTNSELKEEVCTLEKELCELKCQSNKDIDKIRCLCDELRAKEELCECLERKLKAIELGRNVSDKARPRTKCPILCDDGPSLAQELKGSPSKRLRKVEVKDLRQASNVLGQALDMVEDCSKCIPSNEEFLSVAECVKRLADHLLGDLPPDEYRKPESFDDKPKPDYGKSEGSIHNESTLQESEESIEKINDLDSTPSHEAEEVEVVTNFVFTTTPVVNFEIPPCESGLKLKKEIQNVEVLSSPLKSPAKLVINNRKSRRISKKYLSAALRSQIRKLMSTFTKSDHKVPSQGNNTEALGEEEYNTPRWNRGRSSSEQCFSASDEGSFVCDVNNNPVTDSEDGAGSEIVLKCETFTHEIEQGVQTYSEVEQGVQTEIAKVPEIETFLKNRRGDTPEDCNWEAKVAEITRLYEVDQTFKEGLQLTLKVIDDDGQICDSRLNQKSYEKLIKILEFANAVHGVCHPVVLKVIKDLKEQIPKRMIKMHSHSMESQFYCTVFLPKSRVKKLV